MYWKFLFVIAVIAGIAMGAVFIKDYLDQTAAADELQTQIMNSSKSATGIAKQTRSIQDEVDDITKRAATAEAAVRVQKQALPERINSNVIVKDILSAGEQFGVNVIPLTTNDWVKQRVDRHEYSVFRATVAVSGEPEKAVALIKHLQDKLYPTLVIESLDMKKVIESKTIETPVTQVIEVAASNPEETPVLEQVTILVPSEVSVTSLAAGVKLAVYAR